MSAAIVRKQELTCVCNGARISMWHLDTAADLETIAAPGGLDILSGLLDPGDRVAFVAGPDRVHGDLAIIEAVAASAGEPGTVTAHLIWSTRPVQVARKAAA
jgi:hypothetical protein